MSEKCLVPYEQPIIVFLWNGFTSHTVSAKAWRPCLEERAPDSINCEEHTLRFINA